MKPACFLVLALALNVATLEHALAAPPARGIAARTGVTTSEARARTREVETRARTWGISSLAKSWLGRCMIGLAALGCVASAAAGDVTLAWNPSAAAATVPDLGYKVYYGFTSHGYNHVVQLNNVNQYTVTNLPDGKVVYFAATAYSSALKQESGFSNEVYTTVQPTKSKQSSMVQPAGGWLWHPYQGVFQPK